MESSPSPPLGVRRKDGVTTITLQRPDQRNTLTVDLLTALHTALAVAQKDPDCRAIVLTGERLFSAGQDLREIDARWDDDPAESVRFHLVHHYLPVLEAIIRGPVPVVAAIHGVAVGAGLALALAADIRLATERTLFRCGFGSIGLVPDCGTSVLLPRIVGRGRALSLLLFDQEIGGKNAAEIGLVHAAVPEKSLPSDAAAAASQLAHGAASTRLTRQLLGEAIWPEVRAGFERETSYQTAAFRTHDAREGITAFLEHRAPEFTGE